MIKDKVVIVTGAGKGIGRGIAMHLAKAGGRVVCTARTRAQIEETAALIRHEGGEAATITADVTANGDLDRLVETAMTRFGKIDILINNAGGIDAPQTVLGSTGEYFDQTFALNARAPFFLSQKVAPFMIRNPEGGAIVNISSRAANMVYPGLGVYGGAKAALEIMTKNFAAEMAPKIRANVVSVGYVLTDQSDAWSASEAENVADVTEKIPMGRLGTPADISAAVLFLCSSQASWITGKVLEVDGGINAPLIDLSTPD